MSDWKNERAEAEARRISDEMTKAAQRRKAEQEAGEKKTPAADKKPAPPKNQ
jgi:hypothetical protein